MNLGSNPRPMTDVTMADSIAVSGYPSPTAGRGQTIRLFLLCEAATFVVASLAHFGVFIQGYEHRAAGLAEGVIAIVLLTGWISTKISPARTRAIGVVAPTFALLGTLVGIFTIIIGVGPRTVPDIAYHMGIVIVLLWGLLVARRSLAGSGQHP